MASFVAFEEAQEKLAELLSRAQGGEEIVIEQGGRPAAKLMPVATEGSSARKRVFGQNFIGATYIDPNWDAPMSDEELKEWGS